MDRRFRLARRAVDGTLIVLVVTIAIVAAVSLLAPFVGLRPFVIRGASMEGSIPRGSLILATDGPDRPVAIGDVISFREPNGTVVTHRVADVQGVGEGALLTTKGDANADVDPAAIPAGHVIGRVVLALPVMGFISAMLTMPSGIASIVLLALSLLVLSWLVAELTSGPCPACAMERRSTGTTESGEVGAAA